MHRVPDTADGNRASFDLVAAARRRRRASYRCELLPSGYRDPWRPWRPTEPSEKQVDAYKQTILHLREQGLPPAAQLPELRLMFRRGSNDRELAVDIAEKWQATA